jgi:uncharacterized protein (TIGR02271 family)
MITREQIPQVVGHPVHDSAGKKIGDAKHMYLDDATGDPEWVTVKTGFFGNNETFVPTRSASLVQDHLEIPYDKETVKGAPNVDVDSGGHLSVEEERHLYQYYDLDTSGPSAAATGKTGGDQAAAAGTAGAAGAAGAAAGSRGRHAKSGPPPEGKGKAAKGEMSGSEAGAGTGGAAYAAGRTGPAERVGAAGAQDIDEAMTRSEEELFVNVERHTSGQARLRKYVDVEDVEKTVPLRHEEVRLEREPITEANRGAALSGPEISEGEHVVTLHEEEAVIDTRVVPKERVRMRVEEQTEQKTVHGRVRKERIEADMTEQETGKGTRETDQGRRDERFR